MASLPRPLIALLVATLAAFGLWYVELKPSSSSSGGSSQGVGAYQSAINQAHQAVKISGAANAKLGAPTSTGTAPKSPTTTNVTTAKATPAPAISAPATSTKVTPAAKTAATAKPAAHAKNVAKSTTAKPAAKTLSTAQQVSLIKNAIETHKVIAVLFYNTAASDDQAVAHELSAVPTHGGKVVKLAVPVSELTRFAMITQQVPVVTAPTLVLIDAARQATTITGFADSLELSQRVDDALTTK
jgi:hypothetical protein